MAILSSLQNLDDQTLLKMGADLSNFLALAHEVCPDSTLGIQTLLTRIGRSDNDLVVFTLRNKGDFLFTTPSLLKAITFDLVLYYFKPQ